MGWSSFPCNMAACNVLALFVERTSFSPVICFIPLFKMNWLYVCEPISAFFIVFIYFYPLPILHYLDYCASIVDLEVSVNPSTLFSFPNWFLLFYFLWLSIHILESGYQFLQKKKNATHIFIWIKLNAEIKFGKINILAMLSISISEHDM